MILDLAESLMDASINKDTVQHQGNGAGVGCFQTGLTD